MKNITKRARATLTLTALTGAVVLLQAGPAAAVDNPKPTLPPGLRGKFDSLLGMLMAIAIIACVAGVFICAILMAIAFRRGGMDEHFARLGAVLIACVLIGSAGGIVTFML